MDSPLLFFAILFGMALTCYCVIRVVPSWRAMAMASSGRYASLDALRGLLASAVLVHHARVARRFFGDDNWVSPSSSLYHFLGDGAVAVFFMITGLLFWGKAIDGGLGWQSLLRSRIRRIMPLYLVSCAFIFAICAIRSGFVLRVPASDLAASVARWLGGGLLGRPSINALRMATVNADVTWTLLYEWAFYLTLVPLALLFVRPARFAAFALLCALAFVVARKANWPESAAAIAIGLPFLGGMAAAYAVRSRRARAWNVGGPMASAAVIANVLLVVLTYGRGHQTLSHLALVPAFVLIALGNDLFGALRQPWIRWLGHISFGIYLLHGIVLLAVLNLVNTRFPIAGLSDACYIAITVGVGVVAVLLASVTYVFVERVFIETRPRATIPTRATATALERP